MVLSGTKFSGQRMNQRQKMVFQGGTCLEDYIDVDNNKLQAFISWREELYTEWGKMSQQRQMSWGKKYSEENQRRSSVNPELREKVIERDKRTCRYCGKRLHNDSIIHIDHVHPFSKGGETIVENLVTACAKCNKTKGYLHSICPLSLDTIMQLENDEQANKSESRKRQKRLFDNWQELKLDRRQHNLEAEYFFYYYDKCKAKDVETLKKLLPVGRPSNINRVYDAAGWIAAYLIDNENQA